MHPNVLDKDDTFLVVVDMQEPFLRTVFERGRVVSNVMKMVEAAKVFALPVVVTLQYRDRMGDVINEVADVLSDTIRIDKTSFRRAAGPKPSGTN